MINALKHAFPADTKDGRIAVIYKVNGLDWRLSIADNGVGKLNEGPGAVAKTGLGTSIVNALAQQLNARVDLVTGSEGTIMTVSHTEATSEMPHAA